MKIIKFSATWCNPCKVFDPIFDKVVSKFPNLEIEKCDVENNPELTEEYKILALPTIVILSDDNKLLLKVPGMIDENKLHEHITQTINSNINK